MSEEKFSKCGEGKKNVSVEFRVFGKKKNFGKKIKVFWVEIFAMFMFTGLVFMLICKLKLREEKMKILKVFKVEVTVAKKI